MVVSRVVVMVLVIMVASARLGEQRTRGCSPSRGSTELLDQLMEAGIVVPARFFASPREKHSAGPSAIVAAAPASRRGMRVTANASPRTVGIGKHHPAQRRDERAGTRLRVGVPVKWPGDDVAGRGHPLGDAHPHRLAGGCGGGPRGGEVAMRLCCWRTAASSQE